ncbi:MAG TPA: 1-deoxy-D-xylulose-5-phosphate synthase [Candidatus Limnocylindrales bacterium]|nr:1-deoxy-D-xylulose-5-phosphate synthase [Candidatus Limnocylindrales bacterium]
MVRLRDLHGPEDLKDISHADARALCAELRERIIDTVAQTGGHLGSSLGVVELTVALHRVLSSPTDRIVWDTGHQAYAHKLLTGRLERFGTLRQLGGIGGFPRRIESEHDVMDGGHAGTGLSIAEGLALARDRRGGQEHVAVVVGDAALMSGLSLEALNDIGQRKTRMIIILNDNEMSISPTVGAVSQYLSRIKLSRRWRGSRRRWDANVARIPRFGPLVLEWSRRVRHAVVDLSQPGRLFEDLGVTYVGPVPGHDLVALDRTLRLALTEEDAPIIVHVRTRKGFGYHPAEADKVSFHGAALPPMPVSTAARPSGAARRGAAIVPGWTAAAETETGRAVTEPSRSDGDAAPSAGERASALGKVPNFTAVMAAELVRIAAEDDRVVAVTAGMPTGTGVATFGEHYPDRTFDVGIAEQHAMTMAAGLAIAGQRPFVALYSTFLQRAFDQVVHDVCQNDAPVVIGIDRAGLVGEDGTSHQGMFMLSALRQLPNLVLAAPRDEQELRRLLRTAFAQDHPFAIQYPRDPGFGLPPSPATPITVGRGEALRDGTDILIVGFGPIVARGLAVADRLAAAGWSVGVIDARFAQPLDRDLILGSAAGTRLLVTLEESVLPGGFGSAVLELLAEAPQRAAMPSVIRIGIPAGRFVDHGSVADLRRVLRLDEAGILARIEEALAAEAVQAPVEARPA